jgi:hypothetical protein
LPEGFWVAERVSGDLFLEWATGVGLGFDPRYPDARCFGLLPPHESARFWVLPGDPGTWPHFIGSVLKGLDRWESGYLWPRSGQWPVVAESRSANDRVRDVVLHGAGIPDGWEGAVRFNREERSAILAVLFAYLAFGWHSGDDLYFVPDHGRQLVQTDHHDVLHVECTDESRVFELVAHMAAAGYELPTETPDETFKRPTWMGNADAEPNAASDGNRCDS